MSRTTVDDCQKFPIKSLATTRRRLALGDPAEKQYFGSTSGVFAGIRWKFDADQMSLKMGTATWPIVVRRNVHGTRTYIRGSNGRLYTCLLVVNGLVGTRESSMKYRSQLLKGPHQRREWKKTKPDRLKTELRDLTDAYRYRNSAHGKAQARPMEHHRAGRKLPTIIGRTRGQAEK